MKWTIFGHPATGSDVYTGELTKNEGAEHIVHTPKTIWDAFTEPGHLLTGLVLVKWVVRDRGEKLQGYAADPALQRLQLSDAAEVTFYVRKADA